MSYTDANKELFFKVLSSTISKKNYKTIPASASLKVRWLRGANNKN